MRAWNRVRHWRLIQYNTNLVLHNLRWGLCIIQYAVCVQNHCVPWWFWPKTHALLKICIITLCIMSKSTVLGHCCSACHELQGRRRRYHPFASSLRTSGRGWDRVLGEVEVEVRAGTVRDIVDRRSIPSHVVLISSSYSYNTAPTPICSLPKNLHPPSPSPARQPNKFRIIKQERDRLAIFRTLLKVALWR